jgi:carotenoid cleavage dioxygenase-like enzyme
VKTSEVFRTPAPGCEDLCIDHPHVNPLFEGRRDCRYVYASLSNEQRASGPPLGYVRVDVKTGETQKWYAGNKTFCEELVVVPKDGKWVGTESSSGFVSNEEEQECWLLGMLADHEETPEGRTCLAILDGADVSAGPVAKIFLKHRVPHGLHGAFVPRRERSPSKQTSTRELR